MKNYNDGKFILYEKNRYQTIYNRAKEYLKNVTIARQIINRELPRFVKDKKGDIIDIGGYTKELKKLLIDGEYRVLDIVDSQIVDIKANAERLPFIDDSINNIICISVIEHSNNPNLIIQEIKRCLAPNGSAFISIPFLFESHMEPNDYYRMTISKIMSFFDQNELTISSSVNNYFGLLAHYMQKRKLLKYTLGLLFLIIEILSDSKEFRYSTQINMIYQKNTENKIVTNLEFYEKLCCPYCFDKRKSNVEFSDNRILCLNCYNTYYKIGDKYLFE